MSDKPITIMAVHAHPDDEVVFTGGTLLKYHRRGVHTVLVTATGGEEGEIRDPDLDQEEARPRLREIRLEELRRGIAHLEIDHHELLGYRDSGMAGTEGNNHPDSFHNAGVGEVAKRLTGLIRRYKPEVIITYDDFGSYGHPDHIKCNIVTKLAFDYAADPEMWPEEGEPWRPLKLYYTHWNDEAWEEGKRLYAERGLKWPFDQEEEDKDPDPEHQSIEEAVVEHEQGVEHSAEKAPDEKKEPEYVPPPTTTRIDARDYVREKMASIREHRTQFDPNGFFLGVPEDIAPVLIGEEHYSLMRSHVAALEHETDLLEGIR